MKPKNKIFLFIFCGLILSYANFACAQVPDFLGLEINDTSSLSDYVKYIYNAGTSLAIMICLISLAYGGLNYVISFGLGKFKSKGNEIIKASLMGLAICLLGYTFIALINPQMAIFSWDKLEGFTINNKPIEETYSGQKTVTYTEIPLGILTEKLVSRQIDCYAFDSYGDPLTQDIKADNGNTIKGPTLLEHDRADCILKLASGIEKKSAVVKKLSDKIIEEMNKCSCAKYGNCQSQCKECPEVEECSDASEVMCNGSCQNKGCAMPEDASDEDSCCSKEDKQKIEHGPLQIHDGSTEENSDENGNKNNKNNNPITESCVCPNGSTSRYCCAEKQYCEGPTKEFKGLDEFRSALNPEYIAAKVEKKTKINGREVTLIDPKAWNELRLVDQINYLKEKIKEMAETNEKDIEQIQKATGELAECKYAKSSVDFVNINMNTDKKSTLVVATKSYSDPFDKTTVESHKYCEGFDYGAATCQSQCQKMCPGTGQSDLECYNGCGQCNANDEACQDKQNICINKCYANRSCSNTKDIKNYQQCMQMCNSSCLNECAKEFSCDDELENCRALCNGDSACLSENRDNCQINVEDLKNCVSGNVGKTCEDASCSAENLDPANLERCLKNIMCAYGSKENAGYPDCMKSPLVEKENYSSSYIYENGFDLLTCPLPYPKNNKQKSVCVKAYPQTAKCPNNSSCPDCPCGRIHEELVFNKPQYSPYIGQPTQDNTNALTPDDPNYKGGGGDNGDNNDDDDGNGGGSGIQTVISLSSSAMVTGNCTAYVQRTDPLTFYCRQEWWTDETEKNEDPLGSQMVAPKDLEIPVGQAVDDSIYWAEKIIEKANNIYTSAEELAQRMDWLGKKPKTEYCRCDSKYDNGDPICTSSCQYFEDFSPVIDDSGEIVDWELNCSCSLTPCSGNPCGQMMDYLGEITDYYKDVRNDYIDIFRYIVTEQDRSDAIKELAYSRDAMDDCSTKKINYPATTRTLSCTRVYEEDIWPVKGKATPQVVVGQKKYENSCYGKKLGDFIGKDLTDNWFCTQQRDENTTDIIKQENKNE